MLYFFRHKADQWSILTVGVLLLIRVVVFVESSWWALLWAPALAFVLLPVMAIKHNHVHLPICRSRQANIVVDQALNLITGSTMSGIRIVHLLNHHQHIDGPDDWGNTQLTSPSNTRAAFGWYVLRTPYAFARALGNWRRAHGDHPVTRRLKRENIALLGTYALLTAIDPPAGLLTILLPNILLQHFLVAFNFIQHYGCDPLSDNDHSRNITGRWFNIFAFNAGLHTAHHHHPGLHWSELAAAFGRISAQINTRLNHKGLWEVLGLILTNRLPLPGFKPPA